MTTYEEQIAQIETPDPRLQEFFKKHPAQGASHGFLSFAGSTLGFIRYLKGLCVIFRQTEKDREEVAKNQAEDFQEQFYKDK